MKGGSWKNDRDVTIRFMQRAFIQGILLAVIVPLIGIDRLKENVHDRRCTLMHPWQVLLWRLVIRNQSDLRSNGNLSVFAALGVEAIRRKIPRYSEMAISIIMSTGIGLLWYPIRIRKNGTNFNSFLFGSIISISKDELKIVCVISVLVLLCVLLLYKELFLYRI